MQKSEGRGGLAPTRPQICPPRATSGQGTPFNNPTCPAPAALALLHSWNQRFSNSLGTPDFWHGLAETQHLYSKHPSAAAWHWGFKGISEQVAHKRRGHWVVVSPPDVPSTELLSELGNALTHKETSHSFSVYLGSVGSFLLFFLPFPKRLELCSTLPLNERIIWKHVHYPDLQTQQGQGDLAPKLTAADMIALHFLKSPEGEASQKIHVITLIIWFPCSNILSL